MIRLDALRAQLHDLDETTHPPPRQAPRAEASTVTAFSRTRTHRELFMNVQSQGRTNACGTTSLANVLSYWGRPTSHEVIDASIRHFDLFTAPDDIVAYARQQGFRAELKGGASIDDLTRMVDQGVPPIVIIDPGSSADLSLHYVTVTGYDRDEHGAVRSITVADSALGRTRSIPIDEFKKRWGNLKLANVPTGLDNVMISIAPADGQPLTGADSIPRFANDIQLPRSDDGLVARGFAVVIARLSSAVSAVGSFFRSLWS